MTTLKEVAAECGLPESTLRLYRDEFDALIETEGEGRKRRYNERGTETLRQIVQYKRAGWGAGQIREALQKRLEPRELKRRRTEAERMDEIIARLTAQDGQIAALRVEVGTLRTELARLVEVLQGQAPVTFEDALTGNGAELA